MPYVHKNIYPKELILLQSTKNKDEATFLKFDVQINYLHYTINIYDKRDDFDFNIVNFPQLDGDVPSSPSYGTYLSQLIWFARVCDSIEDFNEINFIMSHKFLKLGFLYHKFSPKYLPNFITGILI